MSESERLDRSRIESAASKPLEAKYEMATVIYPILFEEPAVYMMVAKAIQRYDESAKVERHKVRGTTVLKIEMAEPAAHAMTEEIGGFVDPTMLRTAFGRSYFYKVWCEAHATPNTWHYLPDSVLVIERADDAASFLRAFGDEAFEPFSFTMLS